MDINNKKLYKQQCYIGGEWIDAINKDIINVKNPATQEIIGQVPKCGKEETKRSISSAGSSWLSWKSKTAKEKIATIIIIKRKLVPQRGC